MRTTNSRLPSPAAAVTKAGDKSSGLFLTCGAKEDGAPGLDANEPIVTGVIWW